MTLTGLEAFAFDYEVKWPLSLVINRKVFFYIKLFLFSVSFSFDCRNNSGQYPISVVLLFSQTDFSNLSDNLS